MYNIILLFDNSQVKLTSLCLNDFEVEQRKILL